MGAFAVWFWDRVTARPTRTLLLVRACFQAAMTFGFHLTGEQQAALTLVGELVLMVFGEKTTTPNAQLHPDTVEAAKAGKQP